jgi:hypothetical protein
MKGWLGNVVHQQRVARVVIRGAAVLGLPASLGATSFSGSLVWTLVSISFGLAFVVLLVVDLVRKRTARQLINTLLKCALVFVLCAAAVRGGRVLFRRYVMAHAQKYDAIADDLESKARRSGRSFQRLDGARDGVSAGSAERDAEGQFSVYLVLDFGARNFIYRPAPGKLPPGPCLTKFAERWYSARCER